MLQWLSSILGRVPLATRRASTPAKAPGRILSPTSAQLVAKIVVYEDRLVVRLKSENTDESSDSPDDQSLTIPWQKPPSKRPRQILLPHNAAARITKTLFRAQRR